MISNLKSSEKYTKKSTIKYIIKKNKDFINKSTNNNSQFLTKQLKFGRFRDNQAIIITGITETLIENTETNLKLYVPNFFNKDYVEKFVPVGQKFDFTNDPDFLQGKQLIIRDANININTTLENLNQLTISNYASFDKNNKYVYNAQARNIEDYYRSNCPVVWIRLADDN